MKQRVRKSQLQCSAQKLIVKGSENKTMGAIVLQRSLSLAIPSLKKYTASQMPAGGLLILLSFPLSG